MLIVKLNIEDLTIQIIDYDEGFFCKEVCKEKNCQNCKLIYCG